MRKHYTGLALLSHGFRPFFLVAILFAICIVPLWWAMIYGGAHVFLVADPVDWHSHEMVFGYGSAVLAGFLFTAVPNWTGRMPTRGWPLVLLVFLWFAGRVAITRPTDLGMFGTIVISQAFLLAVTAMIAREVIVGRNWRNLKVLIPLTVLWLAEIFFHLETFWFGSADHTRRLAISVLIFFIMLIGGRIIPSFTRNWLAKRQSSGFPVPFNRFDGVAIGVGLVALGGWIMSPMSIYSAALATLAGCLHLVRLARWRGASTIPSPLLLMLHLAYLMIPFGFFGIAASGAGWTSEAFGVHFFGIGAIGGMTMAVMMRATLGHTGRELAAGAVLTLAFALILAATVMRTIVAHQTVFGVDGISISAGLWTLSYALVLWRLGPLLLRPKRTPN